MEYGIWYKVIELERIREKGKGQRLSS